MQRHLRKSRSRSGMAMLIVLFIVMAIAVFSTAFISRSDTALACGRNFCLRTEADYAAWGGLEAAWALVQDPNTLALLAFPVTDQLDGGSDIYYTLTIDNPVSDVYPVECTGFQQINGQQRVCSTLYGDLYYDAEAETARYLSVRRRN